MKDRKFIWTGTVIGTRRDEDIERMKWWNIKFPCKVYFTGLLNNSGSPTVKLEQDFLSDNEYSSTYDSMYFKFEKRS